MSTSPEVIADSVLSEINFPSDLGAEDSYATEVALTPESDDPPDGAVTEPVDDLIEPKTLPKTEDLSDTVATGGLAVEVRHRGSKRGTQPSPKPPAPTPAPPEESAPAPDSSGAGDQGGGKKPPTPLTGGDSESEPSEPEDTPKSNDSSRTPPVEATPPVPEKPAKPADTPPNDPLEAYQIGPKPSPAADARDDIPPQAASVADQKREEPDAQPEVRDPERRANWGAYVREYHAPLVEAAPRERPPRLDTGAPAAADDSKQVGHLIADVADLIGPLPEGVIMEQEFPSLPEQEATDVPVLVRVSGPGPDRSKELELALFTYTDDGSSKAKRTYTITDNRAEGGPATVAATLAKRGEGVKSFVPANDEIGQLGLLLARCAAVHLRRNQPGTNS